MDFRMSSYGGPGGDPNSLICIVYAYVRRFANGRTNLQFAAYNGPEADPIILSLSRPRELTIFAATFGTQDVTPQVQRLISGQETLTLNTATLRMRFQSPTTGLPSTMAISIMYQYEGGDMQVWSAKENQGILFLTAPTSSTSKPLTQTARHPRAGEPNILALVWGDGSKVDVNNPAWPWAEVKNDAIFTAMSFIASLPFFGGSANDSMPNVVKSCHVCYSYGVTGTVRAAAAYEGATLTLEDRDLELTDPMLARVASCLCFHPDRQFSDPTV